MSEIVECTRGSLNPFNAFKTLYYKFNVWRDNPLYFNPDGIWCFCGAQGSGKTLSAVQCLQTMVKRYPMCRVISNMPVEVPFHDVEEYSGHEMLHDVDNGVEGVIFFLDEIHLFWNSLESKNIPFSDMAAFCQMRKARRVIIGTSQVYGRIAKPIREQLKYIIDCRCIGGFMQVNKVLDPSTCVEIDGRINPDVIRTQFWFHRPELYSSYETLQKIERREPRFDANKFLIPKGVDLSNGSSGFFSF